MTIWFRSYSAISISIDNDYVFDSLNKFFLDNDHRSTPTETFFTKFQNLSVDRKILMKSWK